MNLANPASPKPSEPTKRFWTGGRVVVTLIVAFIGALSLLNCNSTEVATNNAPANRPANGPDTATNVPPAAFVSLPPAVRDTKLQTLNGESFKLSDYNDKVLVVNIWATWCGPCRQEMPELVKMNNEYKARGL